MNIIDLTLHPDMCESDIKDDQVWYQSGEVPLSFKGIDYTGIVYDFKHGSMVGSYIDFPGHIKELDNGMDAANYPLEKLYRIPATVIHLDKEDGSGGVTAAELQAACPEGKVGEALVINALGNRRFDEIECRSVWLADCALDWIVQSGTSLVISDIYESQAIDGVFYKLFQNEISTVCLPVNLAQLTEPEVSITVLPLPFAGVTQLPCRIIAEMKGNTIHE